MSASVTSVPQPAKFVLDHIATEGIDIAGATLIPVGTTAAGQTAYRTEVFTPNYEVAPRLTAAGWELLDEGWVHVRDVNPHLWHEATVESRSSGAKYRVRFNLFRGQCECRAAASGRPCHHLHKARVKHYAWKHIVDSAMAHAKATWGEKTPEDVAKKYRQLAAHAGENGALVEMVKKYLGADHFLAALPANPKNERLAYERYLAQQAVDAERAAS